MRRCAAGSRSSGTRARSRKERRRSGSFGSCLPLAQSLTPPHWRQMPGYSAPRGDERHGSGQQYRGNGAGWWTSPLLCLVARSDTEGRARMVCCRTDCLQHLGPPSENLAPQQTHRVLRMPAEPFVNDSRTDRPVAMPLRCRTAIPERHTAMPDGSPPPPRWRWPSRPDPRLRQHDARNRSVLQHGSLSRSSKRPLLAGSDRFVALRRRMPITTVKRILSSRSDVIAQREPASASSGPRSCTRH